MLVFPDMIASLFAQAHETELLALSARALQIYSLTFLTRWIGFTIQSFLVTLERPLPATILSLANALILPVALLPVLWPFHLDGLWLNAPITSALVAALALIFYTRLRKNVFAANNK